MGTTHVRVAIAAAGVSAVAVGGWFAAGTPGLGGERPVDALEVATEPSPTATATPTPTATASRKPSSTS